METVGLDGVALTLASQANNASRDGPDVLVRAEPEARLVRREF